MPTSGNLYYSCYPDGQAENPPVVLIHGAGGTHLHWPAEVRRMHSYRVYALDLPGHGKSEVCDGQQTIEDYARYLVQWLESIHLRRAVFVGHSMGSAIALTLATQYPEYVVALGLVGAGARLRVNPQLLSYISDPTTFLKATDLLVACSFSPAAPLRLVELATRRMETIRRSVLHGDLLACDRFDLMGRLGSISLETLVICGADDQMTPVRYAQYLASSLPHARLSVIPNSGHMVMLEQPQLVADSLLSFLKDITFFPGEGS